MRTSGKSNARLRFHALHTRFTAALTRRPAQGPPRKYVHVQMENGLAGLSAVVDREPERAVDLKLAGDLSDSEQHMTEQRLIFLRGIRQPIEWFSGDQQQMHRRLRIDVLDSEAQLV